MNFGDRIVCAEDNLRDLLRSLVLDESRIYNKKQVCDFVGISNEKMNRFLGVGKHSTHGSLQLDDMISILRAFENFRVFLPVEKMSDQQRILVEKISEAMNVSSSSDGMDSLYEITEKFFRTNPPDIEKMTKYLVGTYLCFRRVAGSDEIFMSPMSVRSLKKYYLPIWKNCYTVAGAQETLHGLITESDGIFYFVGRSINRRIFNMMSIVRPPHHDVPYFNGVLNTTTRNTPTLARVCIVRTEKEFRKIVPDSRRMTADEAFELGLPDLKFISNINDTERALAPIEDD